MFPLEDRLSLLESINNKIIARLSYWNTDCVCIYANQPFLELLSASNTAIEEKSISSAIADDPQVMLYLKRALEGENLSYNYSRDIDGKKSFFLIHFFPDFQEESVKGCVMQVDDITALKQKELAHAASELKFKTILESAPDALIIADSTGTITLLNSRAEALFGYKPSMLIGKKVEMLMPERFRQSHPDTRNGFISNPHARPMGNLILYGLRKNGEEFPTDVSLSPMKTEEGLLIAASFRDITQQVAKEKELKKYHEELAAQSHQIETILGSISESFAIVDKDWRISYWNTAAEKTTGKTKEQVIGKMMWDIFPQAEGSVLYSESQNVMKNRIPSHFEHFSSEELWFYNSVHPNDDGGITMYFKNITARKNNENELIAIKNNQHALINATKDLMVSVDGNYRLISANQGYHNFVMKNYGYKHVDGDEILFDRNKGEENLEWKLLFDRCMKGESFLIELESMPEHVTQFNPIYDPVSGNINGVACLSSNISERNLLEKEKLESAERFKAVVQNGSDLIFIIDENYKLQYVSPSVFSYLGYEPDALHETLLRELIHPKSFQILQRQVLQSINKDTVHVEGIRIKDAKGNWQWIEATIDNLLENKAVKGLVINAKDITERKKRETERELLFKELTRSNSDLMQFSFITSHNLMAPLSNITGLLAFMDKDTLDEGNREIIDMIASSAAKLSETISDLTNMLVIKNKTQVPTANLDLKHIFKRVNRNFLEAENNINAIISLDFQATHMHFNERYLESIFINLISNAIKYRHHERALKINVASQYEEDNFMLSFSDNGLGIDLKRHGNRLFGMYQRFHAETEGQGLGLFIIKSQIDALGGTVEVKSKVGKGTEFLIRLPLKQKTSEN